MSISSCAVVLIGPSLLQKRVISSVEEKNSTKRRQLIIVWGPDGQLKGCEWTPQAKSCYSLGKRWVSRQKKSTGGNLWQNLPGSQTHGNPSPFEERLTVDAALREYRELCPWRVSNRCPNLYGFILKTSHSWFIGYHFFLRHTCIP